MVFRLPHFDEIGVLVIHVPQPHQHLIAARVIMIQPILKFADLSRHLGAPAPCEILSLIVVKIRSPRAAS